jgi:hypothetical protein
MRGQGILGTWGCALALFSVGLAEADDWVVTGGTVTITWNEQLLDATGWSGPGDRQQADYPIDPANDLLVVADGRAIHSFAGTLPVPGFGDLESIPGERDFLVRSTNAEPDYLLDFAHIALLPDSGELHMRHVNLRLTPAHAQRLGHPAWKNLVIGGVDMVASVKRLAQGSQPEPLGGDPCATNFGPQVDVALSRLEEVQEWARTSGAVALTFDTETYNVGAYSVPWYWSIAPAPGYASVIGQHPYLILNLYRIGSNGRLLQIGRSDVKHAFFSSNFPCDQNPDCAGGQAIVPGCRDLYGANNNANQMFFAPRYEVTSHSGDWTSLGSHFDGTPVDDHRSHSNGPSILSHRLVTLESELQVTGAQFLVEAWYIVKDDTNLFNNLGYRRVDPSFSSIWTFATVDAGLATGAAINAWVDPASPGSNRANSIVSASDGHLQLAVAVTNLGGGSHRYDYALMNLDFDRQIRSFTLPMPAGVAVSNLLFFDVDANGANSWIASATNGLLSWQADVSGANSNTLDWGTMYAFSFEANAPPTDSLAQLGVLEPGAGSTLAVHTKGLQAPSFAVDLLAPGSGVMTQQWTAISGALYRVQTTTNLEPGAIWQDAGGVVTANGTVLTVLDTNAPATQKFYRAVLQTYP